MAVKDCSDCGACCMNPLENKAEGYAWYVQVEGTALLDQPDRAKKLVVRDPDGVPHMRLQPDGRCVALRGKIGRDAHCSIYPLRPRGYRLVMPGDANCLRARLEQGIDLPAAFPRSARGAK